MRACPAVTQIEAAGSYRRGKETIGDLDFLVVASDAKAVMDRLASYGPVAEVLGRGRHENVGPPHQRPASGPARGAGRIVRRRPAILHRLEAAQHRAPRPGQGPRAEDQRIWRIPRGGVDCRAHRGGSVRGSGLALLPARAARSPAGIRVGQPRQVAATGGTRRHPRRPAHAQHVERRYGHHRGNGPGRQRPRPEIHRHDRPLPAGLHGRRTGRQAAPQPMEGNRPVEPAPQAASWCSRGWRSISSKRGGLDLDDDVLAEADWVVASLHYGQNQPREQITRRRGGRLAESARLAYLAIPPGGC